MPRRARMYIPPSAFSEVFKTMHGGLVEVERPSADDGRPICESCKSDWGHALRMCSQCGTCAHETCGGAHEESRYPLCEPCGRTASICSDDSQAQQVGSASEETEEGSESEGSLADLIADEESDDNDQRAMADISALLRGAKQVSHPPPGFRDVSESDDESSVSLPSNTDEEAEESCEAEDSAGDSDDSNPAQAPAVPLLKTRNTPAAVPSTVRKPLRKKRRTR
ncbi:hypothetical protein DIPPA_31584 [Diplonema papillatum]|nr:hypothetical protein DIPPA_30740 [Diplonema papillatum]KAJ9454938.1 hypothetical protein DIPPA_31584 [Diplonema papillatum]|eukprot:gene377-539_t